MGCLKLNIENPVSLKILNGGNSLVSKSGERSYCYGFQGQESDDEIKGAGNSVNYKYRMHDPRIGRFFAVDPLAGKYPYYTPYAFSGNRVIDAVELEGLEPVFIHGTFSNSLTFSKSFRSKMLNATGWAEKSNESLNLEWSGANSVEARESAAKALIDYLTSEENIARMEEMGESCHATLISHSHGGNVAKLVQKSLEELGWVVDIVNISTPQRTDFQGNENSTGKYVNFYSDFDLIQFIGSFNSEIENIGHDSRIDDNAKQNIEVDNWHEYGPQEYKRTVVAPFIYVLEGAGNLVEWIFYDSVGHSLHNAPAQQQIIQDTKTIFNEPIETE